MQHLAWCPMHACSLFSCVHACGLSLSLSRRVLSSILQVQEAVIASGRSTAPHVVAKVHRYGSKQVRACAERLLS